MDGLTDFLIVSAAALYLTYVLTKISGPFGISTWIRHHLSLGGMTKCFVCAAFWCGLAVGLLWLTPLRIVVYPLAFGGVVIGVGFYTGMAQWTTKE